MVTSVMVNLPFSSKKVMKNKVIKKKQNSFRLRFPAGDVLANYIFHPYL